MSWEDTFSSWSQGPSEAEQGRCDNAVSVITSALNDDEELARYDILVFPQGSYRNRTNVKLDSDVDICIMLKDTFFEYYPQGMTRESVGNSSSSYSFATFKNSVERALVSKFGRGEVTRGNKAFDIHENSYRVDADVIPTFQYRSYTGEKDYSGNYMYHSGVKLITDGGNSIINWPEQTYQNGVEKHDATRRRYKRCIRILKRLRNHMQDKGVATAQDVASFLIECLVWNTPPEAFAHDEYTGDIRWILAHTCNATRKDEDCKEWGEVNELKYLFRPSQSWTMGKANSFLNAAWNYVGYK